MKKLKIIITDHYRIFKKGLLLALAEKTDIEFIGDAGNGQELLELLQYQQPDVVITDLRMPVMDGLDTIKKLKQQYPQIKIMVLTMYDHPKMAYRALQLGANAYLLKSCSPEEIYNALTVLKEHWLYVNDEMREALWQEE